MKKHIFLFILFPVSFILYGQWNQQISGTESKLNSVTFVDNENGWIVGNDGTILRTSDGGENWIQQNGGTDLPLKSVHFADHNNGWIAGGSYENGYILRTSDGGANWEFVFYDPEPRLNCIFFIDTLQGWAAGEQYGSMGYSYGKVLFTDDGGLTWNFQSYAGGAIKSVRFLDEDNGWVVGGGYNGSNGYPYSYIYNTNDGGNTWNEQLNCMSGEIGALHSVYFTDHLNGWAVGGNRGVSLTPFSTILHTNDGGNNWEIQTSLSNRVLTGVYFTDNFNGWAVGGYTSYGWIPDTCILLRTINGGENWNYSNIGTSNALVNLIFDDEDNGWIVGDSGVIFYTEGGGQTDISDYPIDYSNPRMLCYPNPFSNELTTTWHQTEADITIIEILNSAGIMVNIINTNELTNGENSHRWKTYHLPPGLYFIRFLINKKTILKKVIKV